MSEPLELDFWDRLVLQPDGRPLATTSNERLVLAIDDLLPNADSPAARARARQRIFAGSRSLSNLPPLPAYTQTRATSAAHRSAAPRFGNPRWAMLAAVLLLLIGALAIWIESNSWPAKSNQYDGRFIPAVQDATNDVVMRGADPGRTNTVSGPALESTPAIGWEYEVEGNIVTVPLVVDGVVYVGESSDSPQDPGAILAIRVSDGSLLWSLPTQHGLSATFAYDRGTIFAVDDNGVMYAVDAQTGTERWQNPLQGEHPYQYTMYSDLLLMDGKLVFTTGSVLAVAASGDALFVGNPAPDSIEGDYHVYAASTEDGSLLWDVPGHASNKDNGVSALSLDDGSLIWNHSVSPTALGLAYAGGLVFFGIDDPATLVALDATTGAERWRTVASDTGTWNTRLSFAVTSTDLVVGAPSGALITVDRQTGKQTSNMPIYVDRYPDYLSPSLERFPNFMSSSVVVTADVAIAANVGFDNIGLLKAVDLTDQSVLWELPLAACMSVHAVVADGRIFQLTFDESDGKSKVVMLEVSAGSS